MADEMTNRASPTGHSSHFVPLLERQFMNRKMIVSLFVPMVAFTCLTFAMSASSLFP